MAGVKFPSSFDVTGRFPLDAKYWVASIANLSDGEIYAGLHRWTIDTGKEYVYQNSNTWKDVSNGDRGDAGTITIGNVTNGLLATIINRGTISDAILDITLPKGDAGSTPIIDIGTVSAGNTPAITNVGTPDRAILNFVIPASVPGTNGLDGKSIWFAYAESATGTNPAYTADNKNYISIVAAYQQPALNTFINWLQIRGIDGVSGKSVYVAYSAFSTGSGASFILNAIHKYVSIITSLTQPLITDFTTWVLFKGLDGGPAGASAYQVWLAAGNTGTEANFLTSLQGSNGKSAYQTWLTLGNTGTEAQFIASLGDKTYVNQQLDALPKYDAGSNVTITPGTIAGRFNINSTISLTPFPNVIVTTDGVQNIVISANATQIVLVFITELSGYVRSTLAYTFISNVLQLTAVANVKTGDIISGYYTTSASTAAGGSAAPIFIPSVPPQLTTAPIF